MSSLPNQLSPSSAGDFQQCPKMFHFKKVLGRPSHSSEASAAGRLTHLVLDELFELPPEDRNPSAAKELVIPAWLAMTDPLLDDSSYVESIERKIRTRNELWLQLVEPGSDRMARLEFDIKDYSRLAPQGSEAEAKIIKDATRFTTSYFRHEEPREIHPIGRELHLNADVNGVSIHGIVDRLDNGPDGGTGQSLVISDYKTGKTPRLDQVDSRFFGLRMYALMVAENYSGRPTRIRLIYVRAKQGNGVKEERVTSATLGTTAAEVVSIRRSIEGAYESGNWPAKPGPLCPYCDFRAECPEGSRFIPTSPYSSARTSAGTYSQRPTGRSSSARPSSQSSRGVAANSSTRRRAGATSPPSKRAKSASKGAPSKTSKKKLRFVLGWALALSILGGLGTQSLLLGLILLPIGGLIGGAAFSMSEQKRRRYWAGRGRR